MQVCFRAVCMPVIETARSSRILQIGGAINRRNSLGFMAGTTGLEPATSAVTVHRFEVFQRLTNPWGTPKTTEVVQDLAFCGSDCGSGFLSLPALPRRR